MPSPGHRLQIGTERLQLVIEHQCKLSEFGKDHQYPHKLLQEYHQTLKEPSLQPMRIISSMRQRL